MFICSNVEICRDRRSCIFFLAEAKDDIAAVVCVLVKLQTNASTKMACLKRNLPTMTPIALHLVLLQIAVYFAIL